MGRRGAFERSNFDFDNLGLHVCARQVAEVPVNQFPADLGLRDVNQVLSFVSIRHSGND